MWGDDFRKDLYREHLEELSFLHEHRERFLPGGDAGDLGRVADAEDRAAAHVDALALGGALALDYCAGRAVDGDPGELHGALRLFCRVDAPARAFAAIEAADLEDPIVRRAVEAALLHELPRSWGERVAQWLAEPGTPASGIAARVLGFRRLPAGAALLTAASRPEPEAAAVGWALGRLGDARAVLPLQRLLHSDDAATSTAAALALLRLHRNDALPLVGQRIARAPWLGVAIGVAGGPAAFDLLSWLRATAPGTACLGMGLLGDARALEPLRAALGDGNAAQEAAIALHLLTGARLVDENDEGAASLSVDPARWSAFVEQHRGAFVAGTRYRLGRRVSAETYASAIGSSLLPLRVRQLVADELAIRHRFRVPLECDALVRNQRPAIRSIAPHLAADASLAAGRWYFAGRLVA